MEGVGYVLVLDVQHAPELTKRFRGFIAQRAGGVYAVTDSPMVQVEFSGARYEYTADGGDLIYPLPSLRWSSFLLSFLFSSSVEISDIATLPFPCVCVCVCVCVGVQFGPKRLVVYSQRFGSIKAFGFRHFFIFYYLFFSFFFFLHFFHFSSFILCLFISQLVSICFYCCVFLLSSAFYVRFSLLLARHRRLFSTCPHYLTMRNDVLTGLSYQSQFTPPNLYVAVTGSRPWT